jgi:hypothetical protein
MLTHLNIIITANGMNLQFKVNKYNLDHAASAHRNSPETLPRVAISLRIVGGDERSCWSRQCTSAALKLNWHASMFLENNK